MIRYEGRVFKAGNSWAIEVPILGVTTQGRTKKDALGMVADAVESLVDKKDFKVDVFPGKGEYFEISSKDQATLTAFLLKRQRVKRGLTLAEIAHRLGSKSFNSYARYEQGSSIPSVEKFGELLSAVSPDNDFVLVERQH